MTAADNACYLAKEHGRNRVHVCSSNDLELARRRQEAHWVTRITNALEEDLFSLVLHPVLPLDPEGMSGKGPEERSYELQLRMQDGQGSEVPAAVFLPAAERYHMAPALDRWAFRHAVDWLAANPDRLDSLIHCCIDLTATSLRDDDFVDTAVVALNESGVAAEKLCP